MMTDPIADMLTRIRNANQAGNKAVSMRNSSLKKRIADVLVEEGFLAKAEVVAGDCVTGTLNLQLRYLGSEKAISGIRRESSPGLRTYVGKGKMPRVMGGLGLAVVSTSKGVMAGKRARQLGLGGELLCTVW